MKWGRELKDWDCGMGVAHDWDCGKGVAHDSSLLSLSHPRRQQICACHAVERYVQLCSKRVG